MNREGALKNINVLDMGRVLAGPLCSAILGDLGADVVKLESPDGDLARTSLPLGDILQRSTGVNGGLRST